MSESGARKNASNHKVGGMKEAQNAPGDLRQLSIVKSVPNSYTVERKRAGSFWLPARFCLLCRKDAGAHFVQLGVVIFAEIEGAFRFCQNILRREDGWVLAVAVIH